MTKICPKFIPHQPQSKPRNHFAPKAKINELSFLRKRKNLIKRDDVGAKPGALAFIALDGGGHVGHDSPARHHEVPGPGRVELDEHGLACGQPDIVAEIVPGPDYGDGLLG